MFKTQVRFIRYSALLCLFMLAWDGNLWAQFTEESILSPPVALGPLNDGHANVSPFFSLDGNRLWYSKEGHPSNIGADKNFDVWSADFNGKSWTISKNFTSILNTASQEMIVGVSNTDLVYLARYSGTEADQFNTLHAFRVLGNTIEKDHFLNIPPLEMASNFFSFFVSSNESFILVSMEGTYSFGKEDLYVLIRKDDQWSEPIHLGAQVNSSSYETSPFMTEDGKYLFFSSEGFGSMGGADIYVSKRLDNTWKNWSPPINLGPKINSIRFDGQFTLNEKNGLGIFVSDRDNGESELYVTELKPLIAEIEDKTSAHAAASGYLRMPKLPSMNVKLNLLDENDQVVQTVMTGKDGKFNIQSFLPDRDYKIAIDDSLKSQLDGAEIFLTNNIGDPMVFMNEKELGMFGFKVLSGDKIDDVSAIEELGSQGKLVDKSTKISGKVSSYGTLKDRIKLDVIDENQNVIETVETDENGYFTFNTKAREKNYFLSVQGDATGLVDVYEVYLTNDNPDQDIVVTKTDKQLFGFRSLREGQKLQMTKIEERDTDIPKAVLEKYGLAKTKDPEDGIFGYIQLGKLPLINASLSLLDENDNVLETSQTDSAGRFNFTEVIKEGKYKLILNNKQNDDLKNSEIYLVKNPQDALYYLNQPESGVFAFRKLAKNKPMTLYSLKAETSKGKVVNQKTTINGTFAYQQLPKQGVKLKLLDEQENVIQVTEVGENGEFTFDNYSVNKNYFIAVEDGQGLSDVYEVYLGGEQNNVLVNRTNKLVYSFRVLPSQDVILTENFVSEGKIQGGEVTKATIDDALVYLGDKQAYFEYDVNVLKETKYVSLSRVSYFANQGYGVIIRLSKESEAVNGEVALNTLELKEAEPIEKTLIRNEVLPSRINIKMNGRDQIIIQIN